MPRVESNYLWQRPGGHFFSSLRLFGDSQGLSHQLTTKELNHTVTGMEQPLIFCFMHFPTDTQRAALLGLWSRTQKRSSDTNEGVVCITKLGCLMFSLVHFEDDVNGGMIRWGRATEFLTQKWNPKWSVVHPAANCKKCNQMLITSS